MTLWGEVRNKRDKWYVKSCCKPVRKANGKKSRGHADHSQKKWNSPMTMKNYSPLVVKEIQVEVIVKCNLFPPVKLAKNSKMLRSAKA